MKKTQELCPLCKERFIVAPLAYCMECFADELLCMEAFMQIERDHGMTKALASKPIFKKAVKTGWKDEYLAEYQANLQQMETKAS